MIDELSSEITCVWELDADEELFESSSSSSSSGATMIIEDDG